MWVNARQPWLHGTQVIVTDGELGPCLIEDPQRLDERRAEAGLNRSLTTKPECEPTLILLARTLM